MAKLERADREQKPERQHRPPRARAKHPIVTLDEETRLIREEHDYQLRQNVLARQELKAADPDADYDTLEAAIPYPGEHKIRAQRMQECWQKYIPRLPPEASIEAARTLTELWGLLRCTLDDWKNGRGLPCHMEYACRRIPEVREIVREKLLELNQMWESQGDYFHDQSVRGQELHLQWVAGAIYNQAKGMPEEEAAAEARTLALDPDPAFEPDQVELTARYAEAGRRLADCAERYRDLATKWLQHSSGDEVFGREVGTARAAADFLGAIDELKALFDGDRGRRIDGDHMRLLVRVSHTLKTQLARWQWEYVLSPSRDEEISRRESAWHRNLERPFLAHVRAWREMGCDLRPNPNMQAVAARAEMLGIEPAALPPGATDDSMETLACDLYRRWNVAPVLGPAVPDVTPEELQKLDGAVGEFDSWRRRMEGWAALAAVEQKRQVEAMTAQIDELQVEFGQRKDAAAGKLDDEPIYASPSDDVAAREIKLASVEDEDVGLDDAVAPELPWIWIPSENKGRKFLGMGRGNIGPWNQAIREKRLLVKRGADGIAVYMKPLDPERHGIAAAASAAYVNKYGKNLRRSRPPEVRKAK